MPEEYLQLHWILLILLIGMGTTYVYGPFSTLLIMTGHLYSNLLRVTLFAAINLALTLWLITDYGNIGVAYAITISMILNLLILDFFNSKILNIHLFKITLFKKVHG
jgi:O-antigen/teichoic acid export membrane protein